MPLQWRREWIADEGYESAGVFDVDGDGVPEIVAHGKDCLAVFRSLGPR